VPGAGGARGHDDAVEKPRDLRKDRTLSACFASKVCGDLALARVSDRDSDLCAFSGAASLLLLQYVPTSLSHDRKVIRPAASASSTRDGTDVAAVGEAEASMSHMIRLSPGSA